MHLCETPQDMQVGRLRGKGQKTMSKSWWLRDTRQDGQTNHCQLPKGTQKTCSKSQLGYQITEHSKHKQDSAAGSSLPLDQCRNPLWGGLAFRQYCNIISYKRNAGPVYTRDIYALITENQIQIGQSEYKFLHFYFSFTILTIVSFFNELK